jgi:hypothetical protein
LVDEVSGEISGSRIQEFKGSNVQSFKNRALSRSAMAQRFEWQWCTYFGDFRLQLNQIIEHQEI